MATISRRSRSKELYYVDEPAALPDVVRTCNVGGFALGAELESLAAVHATGVAAASVFLSGRILEALSDAAVHQVGMRPSQSVFQNLVQLDQLGLLPLSVSYWGHALRRTANE